MTPQTCGICQQPFVNTYQLSKHRKQEHPEFIRNYNRKTQDVISGSAVDKILAAKKQIKDALADLDVERSQCQQKLLDLDNMIAKYKTLV